MGETTQGVNAGFQGRWLPETEAYRKACLRLAKNMAGFKRDSDYTRFVGNDTRGIVVARAFYEATRDMAYCGANDVVGEPVLHDLDGSKSAGTLRFMKVVKDLRPFDYQSVVEIGGGYGGQCLVLQEYEAVAYAIIDIPEALELARAYLRDHKVYWCPLRSDQLQVFGADLVISDYALSEFDEAGIEFYMKTVIEHCQFGYFTVNSHGAHRECLLRRLEEHFKLTIRPEEPPTSRHDNIIVWGEAR